MHQKGLSSVQGFIVQNVSRSKIRTINSLYRFLYQFITMLLSLHPLGSCDCVSFKDCSSVFRSTLVGHPSGYSCWDFDACTISIFTMEGKSYLTFESHDINLILCFKVWINTDSITFCFFIAFPQHVKLFQHTANFTIVQLNTCISST